MNIVYVSLTLLVFMPSVLYAADKCPAGEKRLHVEEECIPETLFNYLYCLEKSGGGRIEISRKDTTEKAKNLEIRLKGTASGVVLKGKGDGGFSQAESIKAAVDFNEKLDPTLASKCENILNQLKKKEKKKSPAELEKENRELLAKNALLENRLSIATDKGELQKVKIETDCNSEIQNLKSQLSSIHRERIVGPGEQSLFDVTKLIISPERIRELGSSFKSFGDGAFFVNEPPMKNWQYSFISEFEHFKLLMPTEDLSRIDSIGVMHKKNLHLWRTSQNISFFVRKKNTDTSSSTKLVMIPQAGVQIVDKSDFSSMAEDMVKANIEILPILADKTPTAKLEALSEIYRGDIAVTILMGLTRDMLQFPQIFSGVQASIITAQKKGNVLYVKFNLQFQNVSVEGKETPCRVLVEREIFIVTSPSTTLMIGTIVPSFDGRSDAYAWIDNWLSGLRIPLR